MFRARGSSRKKAQVQRPDRGDVAKRRRAAFARRLNFEWLEERMLLSVAQANGPEFQVNTYTTGYQNFQKVASDAAGDYVVVWESAFGQDGDDSGIYAQRYNASGVAEGSEFRVNTYTTSNQKGPSVAMDSAGDFVIAWVSFQQTGDGSLYGIFAQRYNSAGVAQGGEFQANTFTVNNQVSPSVAMDSAGDFVIAWQSGNSSGSGQDGSDYGIYAQRFSALGTAQGSEFLVNTYTAGNQDRPSVAMDAAGDFVVAWQSYDQDGSDDYGIFAQRYSGGGAIQGSEFKVNTYTTGNQESVSAAMDSTGDFVITWMSGNQDGSGYGIYAQRYQSSGAAQGSELRVNAVTIGSQQAPAAAMDAVGDFVVAWESFGEDGDGSGIYAQRYGATGAAEGSEFRTNTYTTGYQIIPAAAMDSAGDFVVTWTSYQDGDQSGVYAQRYLVPGAGPSTMASGSEFQVNTYTSGNQEAPKVASDAAGDYVVAWASKNQDGSGYGVYAQRYNSSGVAQGGEFRVNTYTIGDQRNPAVAMDSAGDFVITWESYQDGSHFGIYAQRYSATGAVQGSEFQVNTYTTGSQLDATVAMDSSGDFVIAWDSNQDGNLDGVYAQRYNSAGVAQGSEFRVNTYTTNSQLKPSVAMDSTGDFVIAWESYGQDGADYGIYAQRFISSGTTAGSEFRVNAYTTGRQQGENVAMDSAGAFVITWESPEDSGTIGIYALRFNSGAIAQGSEFLVNTYTTGGQRFPAAAMDSAGDFVVTWWSFGQDGDEYGIFAQRFSSTGAIQGSEFQVNNYTTSFQRASTVAMDSAGDFVIAWQSYRQDASAYGVYAKQFKLAQPTAVGGEVQVNTYTTNQQENPKIAMDATGDYVVVWQSSVQDGSQFGIYGQRYSASGAAVGGEFRVNTFTTGSQMYPAVAMDAAGDFIVAWTGDDNEDGSGYGIFAQRYNASGATVGGEFRVNTYTTGTQGGIFSGPSVAADAAGDFVVSWSSYNEDGANLGIFAQRYNASGVAQGGEFQVNTYTTARQDESAVAMDAVGDFVVTWESGYGQDGQSFGIYGRRYNAAGVTQGGEFQVNTYITGGQSMPAIGMDSQGDFVVAWMSNFQDGDQYGIYAQRYSSAGNVQGSEFRVNTYTAGFQEDPSVGMDASGDFAVTWLSPQDGGSGSFGTIGVYAQRYDANGIARGSEMQVNVYTTGAQTHPAAAMDADGDYAIAWESYGQDAAGNYGVYAQHYRYSTPPVLSTTAGSLSYTANSGAQPVDFNATLTDGESTIITGATVTISGYFSGEDVLSFTSQHGISGSFNAGTGVLTLSGTATVGDYQSVLESITYDNAAQDAHTASRTVSYAVTDGINTATGSRTINPLADPAVYLVVTGEPPATVTAGVPFSVTVSAEDANFFVVSGYTGSVSLSMLTGPGGTLGGTTSVNATSGVAVFNDLTLSLVGDGYTLQATSGTLASATTSDISVVPGAATQFIISGGPPSSMTAGSTFGFTVTAEDVDDNVATGFGGSVTANVVTGPGGGTLSGGTSITATSGVAVFSTLALNKAGNYTLDATSGTITSAATSTITVTPGTATQFVISGGPPSSVAAGSDFGFTVTAEDSHNNVDTNFTSNVSIAIANNPGGSTLSGTASEAATAGVAVFSNLSLNKVGTGYTLKATDAANTSINATTSSLTVVPGAVTQLLITGQPPSTVTAGNPFGFSITAEDADGNVATNFSGSVTAGLVANPSGGTLSGGTSVNAISGVATFTTLALDKAGSGYTLDATSGIVTSAATSAVSIAPGSATQFIITTEPPASVSAGSNFGFTVTAEDSEGNVATGFNGTIMAALATNPSGGTLMGGTNATAASGVAIFSTLALNKVGSYTLDATAGTITSAASNAISVTPGSATQLIVTGQPPASVTPGSNFNVTVTAEDSQGNLATGFSGSETISLAANPGGSTLSGTTNMSAVAGVAVFSGLSLDKVGTGYQLQIASTGLPTVDTSSFNVQASGPSMLSITGNTGDHVTISFTDAGHFTVTITNGSNTTSTSYSVSDVDKLVYSGPSGASQVVFVDHFNSYTATQSLASTDVVGTGFEFDAASVATLYVYAQGTATVNVAGGTGNNFYVDDLPFNYSYIADPINHIYSELSGFAPQTVSGSGGTTYAYVYSTSGAQIVLDPTGSTVTVNSLATTLSSFAQLYAVGASDGSDQVTLHTQGGNFVGTPGFSYVGGTLSGNNFLIGALYCANVTAQATHATDGAFFYSYGGDTFSGAIGNSSLTGSATAFASYSTFTSTATGFQAVSVLESGGATDVANLTSPGGGTFVETAGVSTLTVGSSTITVNTFLVDQNQNIVPVAAKINVTGKHDGTDSAFLYDSPGTNALAVGGSTATLTNTLLTVGVNDFGSVTAEEQNGSSDTDHQTAAIDFALQLVGDWTTV